MHTIPSAPAAIYLIRHWPIPTRYPFAVVKELFFYSGHYSGVSSLGRAGHSLVGFGISTFGHS